MKHSLKRLVVGGALAGAAFAAAPAIASASSTCTFDTASHQVVIMDGSGSGQLIVGRTRFGYLTYADDFGDPQLCVKGTTIASIGNTDSIYVQGPLVGASDGYFVDEYNGGFAPGLTHESTGQSDIEMDFNPTGSAVKPSFTVRGTEQDDHILVSGTGKIDLNGDFDPDVTLDGASFAGAASRVIVYGGAGDDNLDGGGFTSFGPATVPESLRGGAGDDTLIGGRAADELLGEDGNDEFESYFDGYVDTVVGGDGSDLSFSDKFDKVDAERNVIPISH